MQIGRLSLLNRSEAVQQNKTEENKSKAKNAGVQNPFGVSFKGNVIQADVFASSTKSENKTSSIAEKGKLFKSAVVSGINNFNESLSSGVNAVVSFGKKVASNVFDTIEKIGSTDVGECCDKLKNKIFPDRQYSVKNLQKKEPEELKALWADLTPDCTE